MKNRLLISSALLCVSMIALPGCKRKTGVEDTYEGDRLILNLRNLYFSSWDGSDGYTEVIQEKFKVKIKPSSYDYNSWGEQVTGEVNGNNIGDTFHFDLESFNFGNTYRKWARGNVTKALPDDLSSWPNLKHLIDTTSNINSLKIDGKLYGIPLAYNKDDPQKDFSSFTYVYRRDWVKALDAAHEGEPGYPLYRENDVYTWEEFNKIIEEFGKRSDVASGNACAIGDVSWGFPSLTNFYKDSPHCYSVQPSGHVVNAFTTSGYEQGIQDTRAIIRKGIYYDQVSNTNNTHAYDEYKSGRMGIYYENLSLSNYSTLRKDIKNLNPSLNDDQLNERTAIMRVKGPDGKFHLEGSENWFSMTFLNFDISDNKMHKILDIMDYLLSEEGTRLAIFGKEGYDYKMVDGEPELIPDNWPKKSDGEYATKINGAKYLREMVTLNNDTAAVDPFTDLKSYAVIKKWQDDMKTAKANGNLVLFAEPANVKWLSTENKDMYTSALIKEGNDNALRFCYDKEGYRTIPEYEGKFNSKKWTDTINEINRALGK